MAITSHAHPLLDFLLWCRGSHRANDVVSYLGQKETRITRDCSFCEHVSFYQTTFLRVMIRHLWPTAISVQSSAEKKTITCPFYVVPFFCEDGLLKMATYLGLFSNQAGSPLSLGRFFPTGVLGPTSSLPKVPARLWNRVASGRMPWRSVWDICRCFFASKKDSKGSKQDLLLIHEKDLTFQGWRTRNFSWRCWNVVCIDFPSPTLVDGPFRARS